MFRRKVKNWRELTKRLEQASIILDDRTTARLFYINIDQNTLDQVKEAKQVVEGNFEEIIDKVMEDISKDKSLEKIIHSNSSEEAYKQILHQYLDMFFTGEINTSYIKNRVQIGIIHSKINLTANFFIMTHQRLFQYLKTKLMQKLHRRPEEMIHTILAIEKLATYDQQLIIDVYYENTFKDFLEDVSSMLNDVTDLDTTEELIESMNNQISEIHNITAATEEMSSSIQEVSDHSIRVAEGTEEAVSTAEHSRTVIANALNDISEIGDVFEVVLEEVNTLARAIDNTQNIITVINEIAEQTNLLALNASIEAARAGEVGQGFAVVAGEVRNLSEHTKEQITQITTNMNTLQKASTEVTRRIQETGQSVEQSVTASNQASSELEQIIKTMQNINHETTQIAAMSEEQAATINDISQRNENMYQLSQEVQIVATDTARVIYDISKQMDDYRLKFIDADIITSSKDIVNIAITDHLLWKWRIYNVLLGLETIKSTEIDNHQECRLGKWYRRDLASRITEHPAYIAIDQPHKEVHDLAKRAVELHEAGKTREARATLHKLERASKEVVQHLTDLSKVL